MCTQSLSCRSKKISLYIGGPVELLRRVNRVALYFETFEKIVDFNGRSTRTEYFVFLFGSVLLGLPLVFIDVVSELYSPVYGVGPLTGLFILATVIPSLSVFIRRLHDGGFSGWWFFIGFVPFVGPLVQLILILWEGTDGPNKYGVDPRATASKLAS